MEILPAWSVAKQKFASTSGHPIVHHMYLCIMGLINDTEQKKYHLDLFTYEGIHIFTYEAVHILLSEYICTNINIKQYDHDVNVQSE